MKYNNIIIYLIILMNIVTNNKVNFYEIHPDFDWKFYLHNYPDLRNTCKNENSAIQHYLKFGHKENRRICSVINSDTFITPTIIDLDIIFKMSTQLHVSDGLKMFKERFKRKFSLQDYTCLETPCIFFGVYTQNDIAAIHKHNNLKIIIWGGEDCNFSLPHCKTTHDEIVLIPNIIHISISKSIYNRLYESGIYSIFTLFNLVDTNLFKPAIPITGINTQPTIFIFNGQQKGREPIYGVNYYSKIVKQLSQFEYIYSNELNANYEEMPGIYSKCFIMLRLCDRDGNANSVQECEAMNIPVIHNHSDYGLKWTTYDDIVNHIMNVYKSQYNC